MYLTVLGCNGPFPEPDNACSGYLIESDSGSTKIALDMGSGVLGRLLTRINGIKELDCVVLSHLHFDHMSDMPVLGYMLDFSDIESLKVICPLTPAENRKLLKGKFDLYVPEDCKIGEFSLEFTKVKHPFETYAVKLKCDGSVLVYTGDSNACPELSLFCDKADTVLADCGLSSAVWTNAKPHMDPRACANLAAECRAKELILTHFSPLFDKEALVDEARRIYSNTYPAEPGMRIRI